MATWLKFKSLYWTRERRSLLCEHNPDLEIWSTYSCCDHLSYCTPFPLFFLLTVPFPMSRRLSHSGDTGNAIYCNTSILSVLSLLLPPLVLSRPAVLRPAQGWMRRRGPSLKARSVNLVKCLRAELRAGCFEFICKTNQLMKLGWNVTAQWKTQQCSTWVTTLSSHRSASFLLNLENLDKRSSD